MKKKHMMPERDACVTEMTYDGTTNKRYISYTTYDDEDPKVLTEAEFATIDDFDALDWSDYIWQYAPDKQTAALNHDSKLDEYTADINARRATKDTY